MRAGLLALRDLVWPASCAACTAPGQTLCPTCAVDIEAGGRPRHHAPSPVPEGFPETVVWGDYAGALKRVIVAHKDEQRSDAARLLAGPLTDALELVLPGLANPVIVPVPSSTAASRRRGRDPLVDVVRQVRLSMRVPVARIVEVGAPVSDQAGLGQDARLENLAGSMRLLGSAASRAGGVAAMLLDADVILVDDVVTTGATLAEAARALCARSAWGVTAGIPAVRSVQAVTICATQRRGRGPLDDL